MEPLPRGSNFKRAKMLWEIGLHVGGDPNEPYTGNRDICITVGSGSGERYQPWLRMSPGSPILAHAVARGELEMAFVNPSALLTQAYRGVGLFSEPLPLRVVAMWPAWDRAVYLVNPKAPFRSLAEVKEQQYPARFSIREDATHSTRVLLDQLLELYGFSLDELLAWGGSLQLNGPPGDPRRIRAMQGGEVDVVIDEGVPMWLAEALEAGFEPVEFEAEIFERLGKLGWRKVTIPPSRYPGLQSDYACLDYGGWPLYGREDLPDEMVVRVCEALKARADQIPWEEETYTGVAQLWEETDGTPRDVPLHRAAERWARDQGYAV